MRALLALEDGSSFAGVAFGSLRGGGGEVVFNTSMTGYQEILTDPSYHGQIVVFTAPHLGNYGIHRGHEESARIRVAGVVTREACEESSHPDSETSLPAFLRRQGIFGLTGVDTRALTLILREKGALRGWMTTETGDPQAAVENARAVIPMERIPAVEEVMTRASYSWDSPSGTEAMQKEDSAPRPRIVVLDCGVKYNILREMAARGCDVIVVPGDTGAAGIDSLGPDGLVLSNGPGDPAALAGWLSRIDHLLVRYPTLAICLGHQLASLALGCRTVKLPFGHHGGNHPVMNLATRQVHITAQNHNYAVDPTSLSTDLSITHVNLNDGTVEGLRHRSLPLWSLQYHPEASPGPHEAASIFDEFAAALHGRPSRDGSPQPRVFSRRPLPGAGPGSGA